MDLPCVSWQDHVAQKWTGLDSELKEKFTSLLEIDDVFKFALKLTTPRDVDFLQSISAGPSVLKDSEEADRYREKGNSSFRTRDYVAAALRYTQGLCFAPRGSEQLPLCFANRSAALYHLQRHQESLDDIDRALKNGYPSHLLHKLEDRRSLCLKHLSGRQSHQSPDGVKAPSVGPVGIRPQAAVGFTPEKGRHLVASEGITAGEVILCDRPFSCVLIPEMTEVKLDSERKVFGSDHRRCHRCLTETLSLVPCDGCSYSRYCSSICRRDAWEEHHRWECPLGAELMVTGVMSQLALRVALKAGLKNIKRAREPIRDECHPRQTDRPDPSESRHGDSYLSVFHLLHHLSRHSPALRFLSAVTIATLYLKLNQTNSSMREEGGVTDQSEEQWMMGSAALRHFLQLRCNAQAVVTLQDTGAPDSSVQSSREIRIATAIFPTLSVLNHSCCPNTSLVFSTGTRVDPPGSDPSAAEMNTDESSAVTVTVRAARGIAAGQEILHCYGPHSRRMKTKERQRLLQEQYYFLCQCEACSQRQQQEEEEGDGGDGGRRYESGLLCHKCKGPLKRSSVNGGGWFVCSQSSCGRRVSSSDVNQKLQQIRVDLEEAVALIERERPDEALRLLDQTRCGSGLILAETHPVQGEVADATARAFATMGDWNKAALHLERSVAAISSQFGDDSIELGRQLFKLAQLHFNAGARGPTLAVIPKVRRLLRLHCGSHCPEIQELQAMEDCLHGS